MAYVITAPCINVKDASCVEVCPVDCIQPAKDSPDYLKVDRLSINPDECIDCAACEPVCPVSAIYYLPDVPEKWQHFIRLNAEHFRKDTLADATRKP